MYAHNLDTLKLPQISDYNRDMWHDNSGVRGGHPGIDIFYGQMYSEAQRARIELYVNREDPPYPDWVYMYMWFIGRYAPYNSDVHRIPDFNLAERVSTEVYHLLNDYYKEQVRSLSIVHPARMLDAWSPPFRWSRDAGGMDFNKKLIKRIHSFVLYPVLLTAEEMEYKSTGKLIPERDKLYVYVDREPTNSVCQWWVASMDNPEVCGWARPSNFEQRGAMALLPRIAKPSE